LTRPSSRSEKSASKIEFACHQREIKPAFGDVYQPFRLIQTIGIGKKYLRKACASSFL
jgi:hypothetical protein